ncbi:unnamed protein product [Caenorhabditis auriculariae]|uniref:Uncharacterized protein n=1 Tax=Caenorhabditis auriculariae TaxID=2777116 RepID=A0A8S1HXF6_9PELO|nr:unnamed protein product [Caenorhabditis auriculariae]
MKCTLIALIVLWLAVEITGRKRHRHREMDPVEEEDYVDEIIAEFETGTKPTKIPSSTTKALTTSTYPPRMVILPEMTATPELNRDATASPSKPMTLVF